MKNNSNSNKPDELFEKLKNIMIEYCSLQDDSSIDIDINYHIIRYQNYIKRTKRFISNDQK